jgi:hypothetical protein
MVPAFSDLLSCEGSENVRLFTHTCPILVKYGFSVKEHKYEIPICTIHTFSLIAEYSAWREHHEPKMNSNLPPPEGGQIAHCFSLAVNCNRQPIAIDHY